jgi:hypothetical protein
LTIGEKLTFAAIWMLVAMWLVAAITDTVFAYEETIKGI